MITAIKAENKSLYIELFEEASDILSGYKRVRTYDRDVDQYFYKNEYAETADQMFLEVEGINSLLTFAAALADHNDVLYVKSEAGPAEGYDPAARITTLEEYFSWLKTLSAINRKYTVLPKGENYFDINANTRAINIPVDYKKNGIAVQSDDLAEILYFRIDRYYDYMDLNNTDIFIQWETPKGPDGKTVKSVSPAYVRDIESEPGKLIFGWAISDAITAYSGALKFSVRFFQWENPEAAEEGGEKILAYSFNTLTATANIQPGINLNLEKDEYNIDDCGDRLIERIENSTIVGGLAAATPVFAPDLVDMPDGYDLDPDTGEYELTVQAYAPDTGAINYTWKKQDLNPDNSTTNATIEVVKGQNVFTPVSMEFLATDDAKNYTYYRLNSDGVAILYRGNIPPTEADGLREGEKLHVKQSRCVADGYGVYWAVAENRITNSVEHKESIRAKFPRPEKVNINRDPDDKVIRKEGRADLSVGVSNNDGQLTYQWYWDQNKDLNFGDKAPDFIALEGETGAALIAQEEGHYYVEVTNTRNKDSKSADSHYARVTDTAAKAIIVPQSTEEMTYNLYALTSENCPKIELDTDVYSDSYDVYWYKNGNPTYLWKDESLKYDEFNGFTSRFNPCDVFEKNEEGLYNLEEILGSYYAIVINHVNGSTAETDRPVSADDDMFIITI